jgi:hypothetical protein
MQLQSAVREDARKRDGFNLVFFDLKSFSVLWIRSVNFSVKPIKSLRFCVDFDAVSIEILESISDAKILAKYTFI